jgi:hypothetical protein
MVKKNITQSGAKYRYEVHFLTTEDWELFQAVLADGEKMWNLFKIRDNQETIYFDKHIFQEHKLRITVPLERKSKRNRDILWIEYVLDYCDDERIAWLEWLLRTEKFRVVWDVEVHKIVGMVNEFDGLLEWYNSKIDENLVKKREEKLLEA